MLSKITLVFVLIALSAVVNGRPFGVTTGSLKRQAHDNLFLRLPASPLVFRGGASSVATDEDEEVDLDVSDEEEEEEIATPKKRISKLAASSVKAADKSKSKKKSRAKSAVNEGLAAETKKASPSKKKKSSKLRIPYILKACLNPFTVFAMTRAYFGSLFNLEYIKKDTSQNLRTALEEKAKKATGGGSKGKRKMRPGQAKTLSDLPQLSQ